MLSASIKVLSRIPVNYVNISVIAPGAKDMFWYFVVLLTYCFQIVGPFCVIIFRIYENSVFYELHSS
jgi:hypothetical protein